MRLVFAVGPILVAAGLTAQTNFPPPPAPAGNPVTANKALLGMALFWEEQLSSNDSVACGTCHQFRSGGADPRSLGSVHPGPDNLFGTGDDVHGSPGVPAQTGAHQYVGNAQFSFDPQVTKRRAPTVVNAGYHPTLFYDGRVDNNEFRDPLTNQIVLTGNVALENLVLLPPVDPVEMGHVGRTWAQVALKIQNARPLALASQLPQRLQNFIAGRDYPALFQAAFNTPGVTPARIAMAIASYIRTLNADQSRWDLYLAGNYYLSTEEQQGVALFRSPHNGAVSCSTCHGEFEPRVRSEGPITGQMATIGSPSAYSSPVPVRLLFHNIGIRPANEDPGRSVVSNTQTDVGKFRVASLRNVELTAPYYHNGSMATLSDVIEFYDRGGDFHANQTPGMTTRNLTTAEKQALLAALGLLTDPRVAAGTAPFDHPTLGSVNGNVPQSFGTASLRPDGSRAHVLAPHPALLGEPAFTVRLDGAAIGTLAVSMWDVAASTSGINLGGLQVHLGLSPALTTIVAGMTQPSPRYTGTTTVSFGIPNVSALAGVTLFTQWLFLDGGTASGLGTSDALHVTVR